MYKQLTDSLAIFCMRCSATIPLRSAECPCGTGDTKNIEYQPIDTPQQKELVH